MQCILGTNIRKPDITFHSSGRIDITASVAQSLNIREGSVIDVMVIPVMGAPADPYLVVRSSNSHGRTPKCFPTKRGKRKSNNYRCHSAELCRYILRLCATTGKAELNVGQLVSIKGYGKALPLITSKYTNVLPNEK